MNEGRTNNNGATPHPPPLGFAMNGAHFHPQNVATHQVGFPPYNQGLPPAPLAMPGLAGFPGSATDPATFAQQQELEIYFAEKGLQNLLVRAVERILIDRPENPVEFLINHLIDTYPEQAAKFNTHSKQQTPNRVTHQNMSFVSPGASTTNAPYYNPLDESMLSEADDNINVNDVLNQPRMPSPRKPVRRTLPGAIRDSRRGSISAAPLTDEEKNMIPVVHPKSEEEKQSLAKILPKYWVTASLDADQLRKVVDAMELVTYTAGDIIIAQGDERADHYFVVKSGICSIVENDQVKIREVHDGEGFGELALLYNRPRCASVVASSDVIELWRLDRTTFRVILVKSAMERREKHWTFLSKVPLLASLDDKSRNSLADALQSRTYTKPGEHIVTQGEPGSEFFIIERGVAEVVHDGEPVEMLTEGAYFGEIALLDSSGKRAATVRLPLTPAEPLTVLSIRREVFTRLLGGPVAESLKKRIPSYKRTPAKPAGAKTLQGNNSTKRGKN